MNITYPFLFAATEDVRVFAGLQEMAVALLPFLPKSQMALYFNTWLPNMMNTSKFVARAEGISCSGVNCTSLILPGGLEQARIYGNNVDHTLSGDDRFKTAEAIITRRAPAYHLDFFLPPPEYTFDRAKDCTLYGEARGQGIYLCFGSLDNRTITAGRCIDDDLRGR